jgi:predicted phosphoadenosine phosphosulfate sulfurtransferase
MGTKSKVKKYIKDWERKGYKYGIPDEAPIELEKLNIVPSYRKICIALMKNENNLETLGFSRKKTLVYSELKRIEIEQRYIKNKQLKLNL